MIWCLMIIGIEDLWNYIKLNIIRKLNYIYMCVIITLYVWFAKEDELNDSYYVPKSKRWIIYRTMKMFIINKLN